MQQQIRSGLGLNDAGAVHDVRIRTHTKGSHGDGDLLRAAGRRDGPREVGGGQRLEEPDGSGQWLRVTIDLVETLPGAAIDGLRAILGQPASADLGDLYRQSLAVGTDEPGEVVPVDREADLLEGQQPGLDACPNGIDKCPVEVEDEPIRLGQGVRSVPRWLGTPIIVIGGTPHLGHRGRVAAAGFLIRPTARDGSESKENSIAHTVVHQVLVVLALGFVPASPLIAAMLQRRSLLGPSGSMVAFDRWLVLPVATLSLGVGMIHAAVVTDHFTEGTVTGLFFVVVAVFQLGWGVMFALRPHRRLAALGLSFNILVIGAWVVTRTVGLPFGAHPGIPEPTATPDLLATLMELVIVAGTAVLVLPSLRNLARRSVRGVASADLSVVLVLIVITLTISYAMADISVNGGHGAVMGQVAP